MSVDEAWFNDQLESRELSQWALARLVGLKPSTVNRMFKGTRRWQLDDVRLAVVQLANKGGRHVRVLQRGYAAGKWNLRSLVDASAELADVDIESAAPVVWVKA